MNKIWKIKQITKELQEEYMKEFAISKLTANMLIARDIPKEQVESYLNPKIENLHDPFLLEDMDKLVDRILLAKEKNEKVIIYGDYDVDGITSITLLYDFLKNLGMKVEHYLPDRQEEGYGLNKGALLKFKNDGASLVITVDCGISAIEEVDYANSIGLDVCITDHHECSVKLPKAQAIVNPKRPNSKYPFSYLAGVGVTFKVLMALSKKLEMKDYSYLKYLDIVSVGTIADIVALVGENRIITYNGLKLLRQTKNEGLKALMKIAGITYADSENVSFGLAPRINASGRMANATVAVNLLLSKSEIEAHKYAKILDNQNKKRQEAEKKIYDEAIKIIETKGLNLKKTMVIAGKNWHQGVIGIVASKLTEKYMKPVILIAYDSESAKGSGRIPLGISLYDALTKCADVLDSFGGHELAAGLTLSPNKIEEFSNRFEQVISEMKQDEFIKTIDIDCEISSQDVTFDTLDEITKLSPFGQKNKQPIFEYKNLKVVSVSTLKEEKHLKFRLQDDGFIIDAMFFGAGSRRDEIKVGDKIDVAVNIVLNEFLGHKNIQFLMLDFKKSA